MSLHWVLWLCTSCLLPMTDPVEALTIAAVVNPNSPIGRGQRIAIEVAVERMNISASPIFLSIKNSYTQLDGAAAIVEYLSKKWEADVILVGAETWPEAVAADVGSKFQIPMITFPSAATTSTPNPWPYLLRIPGLLSSQLRCIADLVGSYNWRRVVVIYEEDEYVSTITPAVLSLFSDALHSANSGIETYKAFPHHDSLLSPREAIREGLRELNESICRVFVIRATAAFATDLFQEAAVLGMMEEGYVWITNDGMTSLLDSSIMTPYIQGIVEIGSYVDGRLYHEFIPRYNHRFREEYGLEERVHVRTPGALALRAYDAVHAIARAATALEKGDTRTKPSNLLNAITKVSAHLHGLSGSVGFGVQHGELLTKGTTFGITNVVGTGRKGLGFWTEGAGFHKEVREAMGETGSRKTSKSAVKVFGSVYWPGGPLDVPGGWGVLNLFFPTNGQDEFATADVDEKGNIVNASGFCARLFDEAVRKLPYKLRYKYHAHHESYDVMLKRVQSDTKYHGVIGDVTILSHRLDYGDFTLPYMDSGLSKVTRTRRGQDAWMFLKPFTPRTWFAIAIAFLYTGFMIWLLEHRSNPEYKGCLGRQIGTGLWFSYSTFFSTHGMLHSNFAKVAILVWLFVALVLTQSYTASLSSILTVQKIEPRESSDTEKVGYFEGSFTRDYLLQVYHYREENLIKIASNDEYAEALTNGKITAMYTETPYLRVFFSKFGDDYIVTGDTARLGGLGFFFRKGSPIAADISRAILSFNEDGTLKNLRDSSFKINLASRPIKDQYSNVESLDIHCFWLLFALSGGTSTIVSMLFLLQKCRRAHQNKEIASHSSVTEENIQRPAMDQ